MPAVFPHKGPLNGVSNFTCQLSKNAHVACHYFFPVFMWILKWSHVACRFQDLPYVMSFMFFLLLGPMVHVYFKKLPYCCAGLKGQEPHMKVIEQVTHENLLTWNADGYSKEYKTNL